MAAATDTGLLGWVRRDEDAAVRIHAEGDAAAIGGLLARLERLEGATVECEEVKAEGHEQFAIRGVSAGSFIVAELAGARGAHYELRLEVAGTMLGWTLPKGPSMDPATRRMAIGPSTAAAGDARTWDRGTYEQGGRVGWPEAIDRGHAVFVLDGERLRGGFALQRTRGGERPQWLLIKRADDEARPGSDVIAEPPPDRG